MEFSRQEYWHGVSFPTPGDLPDPGSKPSLLRLLRWQTDSLPLAATGNRLISPVWAVLSRFSHVRLFVTLWTAAHQLLHPWGFPGKNTGVGCPAILQVISYTPIQNKTFF